MAGTTGPVSGLQGEKEQLVMCSYSSIGSILISEMT
jgi:hypothetical protein